jgi:hypothetical protein
MTSLQSAYAQIPSNKLYVNIGDARSTITDINLSTPSILGAPGPIATALTTAGLCILRDMGKTVYLPAPSAVGTSAVGGISTVLRKVQVVPSGANGSYGVGGPISVGGVPDAYTGYIQIGALTYGGGNGVGTLGPIRFVRLN